MDNTDSHHIGDANIAHFAVGISRLPRREGGTGAVYAVEVGLHTVGVRRQHVDVENARRPATHEQDRLALELTHSHGRQLRTLSTEL